MTRSVPEGRYQARSSTTTQTTRNRACNQVWASTSAANLAFGHDSFLCGRPMPMNRIPVWRWNNASTSNRVDNTGVGSARRKPHSRTNSASFWTLRRARNCERAPSNDDGPGGRAGSAP